MAWSALAHISVAGAAFLTWQAAAPPVTGANILSVEIIMESPSPGGSEGIQQQLQETLTPPRPTPEPIEDKRVVETADPAMQDIDEETQELNPKASLVQDVPISKTSDIVLKRKPKPPVQKQSTQKTTDIQRHSTKEASHQALQNAQINLKGQQKGETLSGATQMAGIQQAGQSGEIQSARYRLGSAANPKPKYPKLARKRGWQGRVVLSVSIDERGKPVEVWIVHSSGHKILDRAALKSVRKWTFQPAKKAGFSVASKLRIPIRFDLMNG